MEAAAYAAYHGSMTEDPTPRPPREAAAASARVAAIIDAAEAAAERVRLETEARVRERIAEGARAGENRVQAAEEEARDILVEARVDAERVRSQAAAEAESARAEAASEALSIVARAEEEATRQREDATSYAAATREEVDFEVRELLADAREIAGDVRAEGTELSDNLRDLGSSLRTNAERVLRDVQRAHAGLTAALDQVDGGIRAAPLPPAEVGELSEPHVEAEPSPEPESSEPLMERRSRDLEPPPPDLGEVPEFLPPGRPG